jgi:hypothetical protein
VIRSLTPEQNELYQRVDEVLHYLWDPIGVSDVPEARDEYHSYAPHFLSLLIRRVEPEEITQFLIKTETETIGLSGTQKTQEKVKDVVELLIKYRDYIEEKHTKGSP